MVTLDYCQQSHLLFTDKLSHFRQRVCTLRIENGKLIRKRHLLCVRSYSLNTYVCNECKLIRLGSMQLGNRSSADLGIERLETIGLIESLFFLQKLELLRRKGMIGPN
jgi:hypothetical protein